MGRFEAGHPVPHATAPPLQLACGDPSVKQRLITNTEAAARAGVFGVPTFVVRDQLFWGGDTIDNAFVEDAGMFEREEMRRVADLEFGAHRKDDR